MKIGNKDISKRCFIIAEAGSNHNRSLKTAKRLIDVAADSGADAVKFQTIDYKEIYLSQYPPEPKIRKLYPLIELPLKWHKILADYARKKRIMFLSCPTFLKAVDLLESIGVKAYKIASPQTIGHLPLVKYVAQQKKPIFLSTGYCTLQDIKRAVDVCLKAKNNKIVLLHCTSKYPTPSKEANLKAIPFLEKKFKLPVGFSDHTLGFHLDVAAVSLGAKVIEKHFTLSRKMKGPDHFYALEPRELKEMVFRIRETEESFGEGKRGAILKEEKKLKEKMITRIIAQRDIKKGEILKENMFIFRRVPFGILANDLGKVLNEKAKEDIKKHTPLQKKHL